jgi:hypothetical protein
MRHFGVTMNKVLRNRIQPTKKEDGKYPFEFKAPSYDNRTSCSMNAGDDYGVGFNQPTGKYGAKGPESGPIPQSSMCFSPDEVFDREDVSG